MRVFAWFVVALTLLGASAPSQQQTAPTPRPVYGTVAGRITCVDTNLPARLASVALQSINVRPAPAGDLPPARNEPMMRTYQTSLDGSFFIPKVPPGTYYVVVQLPGYLSPIRQFSRAELERPTAESLARILKAVPTVTVEANHTATADMRIERGAELSGTIRFDDGTPIGNLSVSAPAKETQAGKDIWVSKGVAAQTDDVGHYRLTGLPPGEYLLQITLALNNVYVSSVLDDSRSMAMVTGYSLSFYSGDVARKDKAKSIKLTQGERRDGTDLTVPLSKLHRVAGTLTDQRSGHTVNAGDVALKFTDGTELVTTHVDPDDGTFHFDFVPEGEYTLFVTNAREVTRGPETIVPNITPLPWAMKETLVRPYGDTSQPLLVQNEMNGLVVPVPPKTAKAIDATQ